MKVIKCINAYLQKNDYVKIPNLGCFKYRKTVSLGELEKKVLFFDYNDQEKDTLLTEYVSAEYQCSHNESLKLIFEFVNNAKNQLKNNTSVSLGDLGCLFKEKEGHIVFHPFLESNNVNEPEKFQKKKKPYSIMATVLFFMFLSIVFIVNETTKEKQVENREHNEIKSINKVSQEIEITIDEAPNFVRSINKVERGYTIQKELKGKKDSKLGFNQYFSQNGTIAYRNQLIAGSFKIKHNANKKMRELKKKGYLDALILGKLDGLYLVAYGTYRSREEVQKIYKILLKKGEKDIWIRYKN